MSCHLGHVRCGCGIAVGAASHDDFMLEKYRKCTVLVGARPAGLCIHRGVYTAGVPSGSVLGLAILPVRVRGWNSEHDALPRYRLTKLLAAWPQ